MRINHKIILVMWIFLCSALLSLPSFGQATASASLEGTVTDTSQGVIIKAQVTLTNKDTGMVRTTQTKTAPDSIASTYCRRAITNSKSA